MGAAGRAVDEEGDRRRFVASDDEAGTAAVSSRDGVGREEREDVAPCNVIVRGEEGNTLVDGNRGGGRAGCGERGNYRVAVRDAVVVAIAARDGRSRGSKGGGHGG